MSISAIPSSTFTQSPLGVSSNNYQQDLVKLGKDLASGSLSAAQQDFSTLQQDIQNGNFDMAIWYETPGPTPYYIYDEVLDSNQSAPIGQSLR